MNTKKILYTAGLVVGFLCILVSCTEKDENQSELPYLFRPIKLEATVKKTIATITWVPVDSAATYTIEISQDSLLFENIIITDTTTECKYVVELGGETRFSARVKANGSIPAKDSKFNQTLTFTTPPENIFEDYSSDMYEQGSVSINWLPNANSTHLVFKTSGMADVTTTIEESEKATGTKICSSLPNGTYNVEIYNGTIKRGTVKVIIEGDYFVRKGDNLATILAGITKDSAIVVVRPGIYSLGTTTYNIIKNIKVRGLFKDTLAIICFDGTASKFFEINTTNRIEFVKFENIEFSGYFGGGTTGTKIAYLLNQSNALNIGEFSFRNCILRNFGNTAFRLQTTAVKTIDNLIFDKCTIFDLGYASVYAVVNLNLVGTSYINNISFTNSSIYNFAGALIVHNSSNSNQVNIENCTFNEITTSGAGTTIRYIVDYNTFTINSGIIIKNCIFGSTPRPYTEGVRVSAGTNKVITGSYRTNDYNDNHAATTYSIIGSLTAYAGASTDLFTNPLTGNFKIKDSAFAGKSTAGDSRWK